MNKSIQSVINQALRENREDREKDKWWASDLGKCLSGVYYNRLGVEPDEEFDDRTLRVFEAGNLFEDFVIDTVKNIYSGDEIEEQIRVEDTERDISGRLDLAIPSKGTIYEVKSIHSRAFWWMEKRGQGAYEHHKKQLMFYLLNTDYSEGHIVYVSKDDLSIAEFVVFDDDEYLISEIENELDILNSSWEAQEAPDPWLTNPVEFKEANKNPYVVNWKAKRCSHHSHCMKDDDWLKKVEQYCRKANKHYKETGEYYTNYRDWLIENYPDSEILN